MEEWICSVVEEAEEETTKCRTVSMVDAVRLIGSVYLSIRRRDVNYALTD